MMKKIWVIVRKEWAEVFKNRMVLFTVAFLPLILTAIPLIILQTTGGASAGLTDLTSADLPAEMSKMCAGYQGGDCTQYILVSQFLLLYLMMPLAIPVTIASYSIVGEKTTRTLEPVLATPVKTLELLAGKALSAIIPAVSVTWIAFAVFLLGAWLMDAGTSMIAAVIDPLWLIAVLVVGPLLAVASVSVAVMVSSRANDPRVAEQLSMLVILPLLGVFFGQIAGFIVLNQTVVLWMAAGLALIDAGLLFFAVRLFQRETILTRWK